MLMCDAVFCLVRACALCTHNCVDQLGPRTLLAWVTGFEAGNCKLPLDKRGKFERDWIMNEEDLRMRLRQHCVKNIKKL